MNSNSENPKLLIVDDEPKVRNALKRVLRDTNYEIIEAANGREAISLLQQQDCDLAIADLRMPEMDGIEFLNLATELKPEMAQILLSGNADMTSLAAVINQSKVQHFISKPWQRDELLAVLEETMDQALANRRVRSEMARTHAEMADAVEVQRTMLPSPVDTRLLGVSWLYEPCFHLGGDAFNYWFDRGALNFYILDVVGHGPAAAMESFALQHQLDREDMTNPALVCARMNERYAWRSEPMRYFVMTCGSLNLNTGELIYSQAGGPPLLIHNRDAQKVEQAGNGGFPVGLVDNALFENQHVLLKPGQRLMMFSDGLAEDNISVLSKVVSRTGGLDMTDTMGAIKSWRLKTEVDDDLSAVLIEWRAPSRSRSIS
jgi:sigma-B regulation protein RsbU (phosphoserine phosphatase)